MSVYVITGHPDNTDPANKRVSKRLEATIHRLQDLPDQDFTPKSESWRDMFDNIKPAAPDVVAHVKMKVKDTVASLSD